MRNMLLIQTCILVLFMGFILCLEVDSERPILEYYNPKYLKSLKINMRKTSRSSPHYIDLDIVALQGIGDNVTCLEVDSERPILEYYNPKYLKSLKINMRKTSRSSPHYIDLDIVALQGIGDNVTISMQLLEYLSGRYQPTPLQAKYKLCDFLYKEPFLGQMYAKQLPANWTCPFPAGEYHFHNFVIHLENFPFTIPFTWASYSVKTRADIEGYFTDTKELVVKYKCYVTITQKPKTSLKIHEKKGRKG